MELELQRHIEKVIDICRLIDNGEEYRGMLTGYLPELNQIINNILAYAKDPGRSFTISEVFVVHVLEDIVYGIEHKDIVILSDVLKHGLMEIYYYTLSEM